MKQTRSDVGSPLACAAVPTAVLPNGRLLTETLPPKGGNLEDGDNGASIVDGPTGPPWLSSRACDDGSVPRYRQRPTCRCRHRHRPRYGELSHQRGACEIRQLRCCLRKRSNLPRSQLAVGWYSGERASLACGESGSVAMAKAVFCIAVKMLAMPW